MSERTRTGPPADPVPPWRRAVRAGNRAAGGAVRGTVRAGRATGRGVGAAVNARGAGESGMGRMTYLHLASMAADTLIITALASTVFFAVPTEAARDRVALSLGITMAPFVLLAPLIGPLLDRVPHGRRYALATTMVVRAFLAWVMAGQVTGSADRAELGFYVAACGFLVCQKAYLVTRAAAVPRVLPAGMGLVAANSRLSLAGVAAMVLAAPLGAGLTNLAGPPWTLRLAFVIFAAGTALALMLPPVVDAELGPATRSSEQRADPRADPRADLRGEPGGRLVGGLRLLSRGSVAHQRTTALRGNTVLRAFTGFLTLFLAFRLRSQPIGGLDPALVVAAVIAVFGVGSGVGTALGGLLSRVRADVAVLAVTCAAAAVSGFAALAYGLWTVLAGAFVAGLAQSVAKLCLDAAIQASVPERVRSSTFARSETALQLAWVLGGCLGLLAPLSGPWGLGIAGSLTAAAAVAVAVSGRTTR